ncbi:MAG: DNA primase [Granulosicoccus sp.]
MVGKIPQHFIDELLTRVDLVDVINARVTLKKAGNNWMACCPFHNEKTPSFSVSQQKQFYHCFGCSVSGNAISFLMEYENMHFVDAIETLADSVGMDVPRDEDASRQRSDNKPLYALLESVSAFYQGQLRESEEAIKYLKTRGLSGEVAKRFGIGYVPDGWDALLLEFPDNENALLKTGMLIQGDNGKRPYQRFRHRIMFPIRDRRGRVIAFGGRVLGKDEPKYLNSPETPLFHKGSELYGLYEARKAAQDANLVIVVEGYMDVVALAQHGVNNAVATLGTAANQQHSETLFRIVPTIVFCFDGDRAGRAAAWRALVATLPCLEDGRDAHFLFLPDGEDPDSVVSEQGRAGFYDLLAKRISAVDYLYQHLSEDIDMTGLGGKAQLADKAKPLVNSMPRGVYRQLAMRRLETLIGLPMGSERAAAPRRVQTPQISSQLSPMSRTVLLVLQFPDVVADQPAETFDFQEHLPGAGVLSRLIAYCEREPGITTARLLERFRDDTSTHAYLSKLAIRQYLPDAHELDHDKATTELTHCLTMLRKLGQQTMASNVDPSMRIGLMSIKRN